MKKANQEKVAPSDIKKGIQKDASVLGLIAFEVLRLSKGHLAGNTIFAESALCCCARNMRSASMPFHNGEGLIPVVFNRDDDVHVLLDPLFDPLMGRFPVGPFFLEHFPIGFHEDRGGWDIGGFGTSQPKRNQRGHLIGTGVVPIKVPPQLGKDLLASLTWACGQQDNDLVPAHPGHAIRCAHAFLAQGRHGLEQLVSDKMPHVIVRPDTQPPRGAGRCLG